jgi:hypothetical protein
MEVAMTRFSQFTLALIFFATPVLFAQEQTHDHAAARGADLVLWSGMQTPQPVPQTAPRPEPVPDPHPETQPAPSSSQPSTSGQEPSGQAEMNPAAQTFSGTIAMKGKNYVLKVVGTTSYQLDDQDKAKAYAGQKVQVLGVLDHDSNMIHVQRIEPLT